MSTTPLNLARLKKGAGIPLAVFLKENPQPVDQLAIIASSDAKNIDSTPAAMYGALVETSFGPGSVIHVQCDSPGQLSVILEVIGMVSNYSLPIRNILVRNHGNHLGMKSMNVDHLQKGKLDFLADLTEDCALVMDTCNGGQYFAGKFMERFDEFLYLSIPNHNITLYPGVSEKVFINTDGKIRFNPDAYQLLQHQDYSDLQLRTKGVAEKILKAQPTTYSIADTQTDYFFEYGYPVTPDISPHHHTSLLSLHP